MKLPSLLVLTIVSLLQLTFAQAQNTIGKISGIVLDEAKKPLDGATVILVVAKDSTLISTKLSNPDGTFSFPNLKNNTYLITVTYIGYKNYRNSPIIVSKENIVRLPPISLIPYRKGIKRSSRNRSEIIYPAKSRSDGS